MSDQQNKDMWRIENILLGNLPVMTGNTPASGRQTVPEMSPAVKPVMPKSAQAPTQTAVKPAMESVKTYRALFPEIYYKLKPYITATCDLIRSFGVTMPTVQQIEKISDGILEDFLKMYPDMSEYMGGASGTPGDPPAFGGYRAPAYGPRRRGLARDFVDALLLAELLSRGGPFF